MTDPTRAPCAVLPWDTAFWGFPIAKVTQDQVDSATIAAIDHFCAREHVRCLYFLARLDDPSSIGAAESAGFRFADVRLSFGRSLSGSGNCGSGCAGSEAAIRPCRAADLAALKPIAAISHTQSRFFFDRRFPRAGCRRLYETWLERSYEGYADAVLVATWQDIAVGYVTCHLPQPDREAASIGLIGVDERHRGRGLGRLLVDAALDWFSQPDVGRVEVVTQGANLAAQRLYIGSGFTPVEARLWFHKWFQPAA